MDTNNGMLWTNWFLLWTHLSVGFSESDTLSTILDSSTSSDFTFSDKLFDSDGSSSPTFSELQ